MSVEPRRAYASSPPNDARRRELGDQERLRRTNAAIDASEERLRKLERELAAAQADAVALEGRRVVDQAIRERRLEAGDRDEWIARYERDPELITKVLNDLNPQAAKILYTEADLSPADKELARQCDIMLREDR